MFNISTPTATICGGLQSQVKLVLVALWITIHERQIMLMDWLFSALESRNSLKGQKCHSFSSRLRPHRPFSSVAQSCPTLHNPTDCSTPGAPVHHQLLEFTQTHPYWVGDASNYLILRHPLLLPSIFPSIRVFSNESALHMRWPKYWSFSFNINPSSEHSGLISLRMDWLDLLAVQGTLKSLLQHHSSKASVFCTQLSLWSNSHIYMWLLEKP